MPAALYVARLTAPCLGRPVGSTVTFERDPLTGAVVAYAGYRWVELDAAAAAATLRTVRYEGRPARATGHEAAMAQALRAQALVVVRMVERDAAAAAAV